MFKILPYLFISFALSFVGCLSQPKDPLTEIPLSGSPTKTSANNANDSLTEISGTGVSLAAPSGFTKAAQFNGLQNEALNASILVTEFPVALSEISKGFEQPEKMAERQMTLLGKEQRAVNGRDGQILKIKQSAYGTEFLKWMLLLGEGDKSVMVTATFPQSSEKTLSEPMKASLLSVVWKIEKIPAPAEGVNYELTETANLKLAKSVSGMLLYTQNGVFPAKNIDEPVVAVSSSISKTAIANQEAFAKERVKQLSTVSNVKVESIQAVTIDELNGYEVTASAEDQGTGKPMFIYQVIVFEPEDYFIMAGTVTAENKQKFLPEFQQLAKSFRRKNKS